MVDKQKYYDEYNETLAKEVAETLYPVLLDSAGWRETRSYSDKTYPNIVIYDNGKIFSDDMFFMRPPVHFKCSSKEIGYVNDNFCLVYRYFQSHKLDFEYKNFVTDLYYDVFKLNRLAYKRKCFYVPELFTEKKQHTINSLLYCLKKFPIFKERKVITEKRNKVKVNVNGRIY